MDKGRTNNDDIPRSPKKRGWKNYQERVRADGNVSRFVNPTIAGKQRWIRIPDQHKYKGKKGYERFLAETLAAAEDKTTNIKFDEAAEEWLTRYNRSKPGTLDSYQRYIRLHLKPYFVDAGGKSMLLRNITSKHLSDFVDAKMAAGLSRKYTSAMVWVFRSIFDPYVDSNVLRTHPGNAKVKYRQTEVADKELDEIEEDKRGGRALTEEEVRRLIAHSPPSHQLLIATMAWTGLRIGETLAMQWKYLDAEKMIYYVERNLNMKRQIATPKTLSSRAPVNLSPYIVTWLQRHRSDQSAEQLRTPHWQDQDLIFPSSGSNSPHPGAPRAHRSVSDSLARASHRAGIQRVRPHDLRHTCATLLIQKYRANIKEVSIHLRHANTTITQAIYGHLYQDDLPTMAKAMDDLILGELKTG